jgi:hypothetical protein
LSAGAHLFSLLGEAAGGVGCAYPRGERHALMVFARASTQEEAETIARAGMTDLGWVEAIITKVGMIDRLSVPEDLRPPVSHAWENGCSVVAYAAPISQGPQAGRAP